MSLCKTLKIILCKIRFNPDEVRLNIKNLKNMEYLKRDLTHTIEFIQMKFNLHKMRFNPHEMSLYNMIFNPSEMS